MKEKKNKIRFILDLAKGLKYGKISSRFLKILCFNIFIETKKRGPMAQVFKEQLGRIFNWYHFQLRYSNRIHDFSIYNEFRNSQVESCCSSYWNLGNIRNFTKSVVSGRILEQNVTGLIPLSNAILLTIHSILRCAILEYIAVLNR